MTHTTTRSIPLSAEVAIEERPLAALALHPLAKANRVSSGYIASVANALRLMTFVPAVTVDTDGSVVDRAEVFLAARKLRLRAVPVRRLAALRAAERRNLERKLAGEAVVLV